MSRTYRRFAFSARKNYVNVVPIIKMDNDLLEVVEDGHKSAGNIFQMFLNVAPHIHCMRATDPALKVLYHEAFDSERSNLFLGTKAQLADAILERRDKS